VSRGTGVVISEAFSMLVIAAQIAAPLLQCRAEAANSGVVGQSNRSFAARTQSSSSALTYSGIGMVLV
jgi:hypothetical protein